MMPNKVQIAVAPFLDNGDLVVELEVNGDPLNPVRIPVMQLVEEYITFSSDMFEPKISAANRNEAQAFAGLFRLCAKRLEEVT